MTVFPWTNKSWHFSDLYHHTLVRDSPMQGSYELFESGRSDRDKVLYIYNQAPIPGVEVKRVYVIHNPLLDRQFATRLHLLNQRHKNPAFKANYTQEHEPETRKAIIAWQKAKCTPYSDPDAPHVQVQPVWHGMPTDAFEKVCNNGYAKLAKTDSGYFGKGIYNTYEPQYAHSCYATAHGTRGGTLVLNWVATYSSYPVVDGDMIKLTARGNYENYDAHLIPVRPENPDNPKEVCFLPCRQKDKITYFELVVFESASCLPRYKVEVGPPSGPHLSLPPWDAREQYDLGRLYAKGKEGVLKNYEKAVERYREAAYQGHTPALYRLGRCYGKGHGVSKNQAAAAKCYKRAADEGLAAAQYYLGRFYEETDKEEEAVRYYKMAANQEHAGAQHELGLCFLFGLGVPIDKNKAATHFEKAANKGHADAQYYLGECYNEGNGVPKNKSEAARYWQMAADQGHVNAQHNMGWCYSQGTGVPKNLSEAARYWKMAADQGNELSQSNLQNFTTPRV